MSLLAARKARIAWIDLLETIAISMVALYHCTAYIGSADWQPVSTVGFYLYYFLRSIFATCVPLFFFVNGYLLFRQRFDFRKHLFKILKFILIAIFWYGATLGFMALFQRESITEYGFLQTIFSLKGGINHLWYLGALVCLYLFFPLLKVAYDHYRPVFWYITLLCLILTLGNSILNEALTIFSWLLGQPAVSSETNFFSIFNPLRGTYTFSFLYFCLGGVVYYYQDQITNFFSKRRNLVAAGLLLLGWFGSFAIGLLYSYLTNQVWDNVWHGYDSIWTLCGAAGIFLLSLNWQRQNRLLATVSQNTLGIYLTHMLIIYAVSIIFASAVQFLSPLNLTTPAPVMICGNLLYAAVVFIVSLAISLIMRKIPLLKLSIS